MFWTYEQKEPDWDGKALVSASEKVETVKGKREWVDLQRFSRRQVERLKVVKVIGWTEFESEDLSPFVPLLRLMEWVHVGKPGTIGLGQILVTT
ncbi:MAG: CRISPR system precrRNA processing endoribonuclease RAMP protein Cas6 [Armatimonadetes bacterium]|nr:CRISPR system precrRNA processing endoribonuclease RAMP protein Cas6 [Armatimonadota bacterium]